MTGYGFNYRRNGGHRTKMHTPIGGWAQFFAAHPDPVCRTCPTCVRFGSCREHPAPCLCGEVRDTDCGHPDCWIAHPPEESSSTPEPSPAGGAERSPSNETAGGWGVTVKITNPATTITVEICTTCGLPSLGGCLCVPSQSRTRPEIYVRLAALESNEVREALSRAYEPGTWVEGRGAYSDRDRADALADAARSLAAVSAVMKGEAGSGGV